MTVTAKAKLVSGSGLRLGLRLGVGFRIRVGVRVINHFATGVDDGRVTPRLVSARDKIMVRVTGSQG